MFGRLKGDCLNCGHPREKHTGSKILGGGQRCTESRCPCVFYREKEKK